MMVLAAVLHGALQAVVWGYELAPVVALLRA